MAFSFPNSPPPDEATKQTPATTRQRPVVAYAITLTNDESSTLIDGAAVVGQSVLRAHRNGSKYDAELVAFVAPRILQLTRASLRAVGYRVLERPLPVELSDIKGAFLRKKIVNNGCCGAWELLKLYAWSLTEYHRVVSLDTDSLVLANLDELFLGAAPEALKSTVAIASDAEAAAGSLARHDVAATRNRTELYALYTMDWSMARKPWGANPPVQGGFFVATPSAFVFDELVELVREGDFRRDSAWGGTNVGHFWGGMTIQGLLPYYFRFVRPGWGREVRGCKYNNMASNPRTIRGFGKGDCRDGTELMPGGRFTESIAKGHCDDCRLTPIDEVKMVHFTICQKPWTCPNLNRSHPCFYCAICDTFHRRWFEIREEFEHKHNIWSEDRYSKPIARLGMCQKTGKRGYLHLALHRLAPPSTLSGTAVNVASRAEVGTGRT